MACELPNEKNVYKCIEFLHENYQQQAYTVKYSYNNTTQYNATMACVN